MKNILKSFALSLLVIASAVTSFAQVGPISVNLSTNRLTAATTNSTAGTGFFIGAQPTVNVLLSLYSTNAFTAGGVGDTNGTTSSVTVRFAGSMDNVTYFNDGTNWDVVVYTTGTNVTTKFRALSTTAAQYFRADSLMSTTTNLVVFPTATYWYK